MKDLFFSPALSARLLYLPNFTTLFFICFVKKVKFPIKFYCFFPLRNLQEQGNRGREAVHTETKLSCKVIACRNHILKSGKSCKLHSLLLFFTCLEICSSKITRGNFILTKLKNKTTSTLHRCYSKTKH